MSEDWGARAARWTGIRTQTLTIHGTRARVLRADGPAAATPASSRAGHERSLGSPWTPQLLVHGLGGAATNWLEVMTELAAFGPVAAPDLPGFGRTEPPSRRAARIPAQVGFLRALADELGWDRVVLHGSSMGGLISLLVAAQEPGLVDRLVLVAPALPTPIRALHRIPPLTLARFAPFVAPSLGEWTMRRLHDRATPEQVWARTRDLVYADPARVAPEITEIGIDNLAFGRRAPWRPRGFAVAAHSLVSLLVGTRRILTAVDAISQPTLLVWGEADRLVGHAAIERVRGRRPDWDSHDFAGIGHVPQLESPAAYLDVVGSWLEATAAPAAPAPVA